MTKDDALKLALEALENGKRVRDGEGGTRYQPELEDAAITAIKEALAQPVQQPWRESASDYERGFIDGMQKQSQSSVDKAVNAMTQRTWVGLANHDWNSTPYDTEFRAGAEWAEAKLKEKNT